VPEIKRDRGWCWIYSFIYEVKERTEKGEYCREGKREEELAIYKVEGRRAKGEGCQEGIIMSIEDVEDIRKTKSRWEASFDVSRCQRQDVTDRNE
jgi:hypothetical protein